MPPNVKPSEELRLNMGVPPAAKPNSLGVVGGDLAGFPNGRRLADDVTDISLKAVAGAAYPLFHPDFKADPLAAQLGDGVDANDRAVPQRLPLRRAGVGRHYLRARTAPTRPARAAPSRRRPAAARHAAHGRDR